MPTLWNWYFTQLEEGGAVAHGVVSGHPRLAEGLHIHTSRLEKAGVEGERLMLTTASGHRYVLEAKDISPNFGGETTACLAGFGIDAGVIEAWIRLREEAEAAEAEKLRRELGAGELLMETVGTNTLRAWFKTDGDELVRVEPNVHVGMFQDSVLITDWEGGAVDFRYFPKGSRLEPYHISDGLKTIRLRNLGAAEVSFGRGDGKVTCPAGETTALPAAEHEREGLFSPDAVNGKGLYKAALLDGKDKEPET